VRSRSRGLVVVLAVAVLGFLAGIALASCGGEDEASPTTTTTIETQTVTTETETQTQTETERPDDPTVVRVRVRGGVPVGGIARPTVDKGDQVVLIVTSDVADEVHVHGYDLSRDVSRGQPARIIFRATIVGRFEIELEDRGVPIAELTVNP
jgi:hypothetical protein